MTSPSSNGSKKAQPAISAHPEANGSQANGNGKARRNRLNDFWFFCQTSLKHLTTVGTFLPTGKGLARALARPLEDIASPRRILEIGPGHGAVTRTIAELLQPGDELVLVEIIPEFAEYLEGWRKKLPKEKAEQIRVHCADFQEFDDAPFDLIICGAPFSVFPSEVVDKFFDKFHELSKTETIVSSYNYLGTRSIHRNFPGTRRRMLETEQIIRDRQARAELYKRCIWRNLPPLMVHYYNANALNGTEHEADAPALAIGGEINTTTVSAENAASGENAAAQTRSADGAPIESPPSEAPQGRKSEPAVEAVSVG